MVIAIEGMDGSGKTSISKIVAKKTNYKYLEKPLKNYLNISDIDFEKICQKIYLLDDDLKALFFGFSNLLAIKTSKQNIILDKHILSTYFWNGTGENNNLFKNLVELGVLPDLTIILYANTESRVRHIKTRNAIDKDLMSEKKMSFGYDKMIEFAEINNMQYIFINGDELSFDDIVNYIIKIINDCEILSKEEMQFYCKNINNKQFKKNKKIRKLCFRGDFYENKR